MLEQHGGTAEAVEALRAPLEAALASDPEFAGKLAGIILGSVYSQHAEGDGVIQNQVITSSNVTIKLTR
jgi:hypothetical protein